jgi:glycosyltransferase involved in cell wall biosynthesis
MEYLQKQVSKEDCLVTVVAICYNHADNLARCLDSILCQKTDFAFKVVVIDDASTDGSVDIIKRYAAADSRVEMVLHEENYYSQGRASFSEYQDRITTPFFHVIETDDYWCDESKLQLQFDALQSHPECIACAHAVEYRDANGKFLERRGRRLNGKTRIYNIYDAAFCHTSSTMFRNRLSEIPTSDRTFLCRDIVRFSVMLAHGKLFYYDRVMSVYRRTGTGIWSSLDDKTREQELSLLYYKIDKYLDFRFTKKFRHRYLPHEGKKLFSFSIPYWKNRFIRISFAKAKNKE